MHIFMRLSTYASGGSLLSLFSACPEVLHASETGGTTFRAESGLGLLGHPMP